ncbi:polyamine deacetylase HDAC10-like [Drosophila miranda]|uniref:polyamine deacetylase HDAC10-like n=1 Tax=Drosophila miranda TaxID=7229 RepID=UPI00143F1B8F|nr:polyamine deacetylase HDAC10-like [Drosophila miranda]
MVGIVTVVDNVDMVSVYTFLSALWASGYAIELVHAIHRLEHGAFWPHLQESDYHAIGEGPGLGFNFNVPLNETGMGDGDYMAIFQQLLLPVAMEYQSELIIVKCR